MNSEQLLKSISDILKKNEQFFLQNPELFYAVQDRLLKAIDYEDYEPEQKEDEDPEDFYNQGYDDDSEISDLFDDIPEDDIDEDMDGTISEDEADDWLKENDPNYEEYKDIDGDGDIDSDDIKEVTGIGEDIDGDGDIDVPDAMREEAKQNDKISDQAKASSSGYREWQPQSSYAEHHDAAIKKYMSEGWSHREAERLANAHNAPHNFYDALRHKVKPSQPSDKMLAHMKGVAGDWLRNAERKSAESADAKKNPIKHASAKILTAHDSAISDFKSAYDAFLGSDKVKGLRGRERHQAIQDFKNKWQADNPAHREGIVSAADAGKALDTAMKERKQHLSEERQSIADVGKLSPDASNISSEFSTTAAGGEDLTHQGAMQSVGGVQEGDEGGYSAATVKDPARVFAEKNPDYVKHLQSKLTSKLSPEQTTRLNMVNGLKTGGK